MNLTGAIINREIKHTGLRIHRWAAGYCTWYLAADKFAQIGESDYIYSLNQRSLKDWIEEAEIHAKENAAAIAEAAAAEIERKSAYKKAKAELKAVGVDIRQDGSRYVVSGQKYWDLSEAVRHGHAMVGGPFGIAQRKINLNKK